MRFFKFIAAALLVGLLVLAEAKDLVPIDTTAPGILSIREMERSDIGIARFFGTVAIFYTSDQPATTFLFAAVTESDSVHESIEQSYWSVSRDTMMATLFIPDSILSKASKVQTYIASRWADKSVTIYETTMGLVDITDLIAVAK
ncbi:MAG TPA: hypothetical protein PKZ83_17425 [bacterium]|nr:hypothetical protein [bacterium]HQJ66271.1 hypothetical protein [bacterium]